MWSLCFVIEIISDKQKFEYKLKSENRGHWIDSGLCKYSRHPNYLGETLLWWGLFVMILPALNGVLYITIHGPTLLKRKLKDKWEFFDSDIYFTYY